MSVHPCLGMRHLGVGDGEKPVKYARRWFRAVKKALDLSNGLHIARVSREFRRQASRKVRETYGRFSFLVRVFKDSFDVALGHLILLELVDDKNQILEIFGFVTQCMRLPKRRLLVSPDAKSSRSQLTHIGPCACVIIVHDRTMPKLLPPPCRNRGCRVAPACVITDYIPSGRSKGP